MQKTSSMQNRTSTIVMLILIWVAYSVSAIFFQNIPSTKNQVGIFITACETLLDFAIASYALWIWHHTEDKFKTIFMLFAFAFLFDAISSAFYNYDMYVLHLNYVTVSFFVSSLYNAPYVITLLLDFIAWTLVLRNIKNPQIQIKSKLFNYIPIYLIITTFLLVTLWQHDSIKHHVAFAPHLMYDYVQFIFYVTNIVLVLLCSALTQNKSIFLFACGYIISLGTSIGVDLGITAAPLDTKNVLEFGWILGMLFILYGFYEYSRDVQYGRLK